MAESFKDPDSHKDHHQKNDLRDRAEAHARSSARDASGGHAGEPADSMLHELRVHQIELEMQNEELRRAQADLEISRARYFDLYDLAPVGYCTLDEECVVQEANLTAARMFGVAKEALIGEPLTDFIRPESQDTFYRYRKQLLEAPARRAFELLFKRGAKASFWGWVEIHSHGLQGGCSCRVAFTDITLLKQGKEGGTQGGG